MKRAARCAGFFGRLFFVLALGASSLPAQRQAEKDRINAAELAAARYRAELANPPGRFNGKFDALYAVTAEDIAAAFMTERDREYSKKQDAWRKEDQRRIDLQNYQNSPAGRAVAEATIAAEQLRRKKAQAAEELAEEVAIQAKNLKFKIGVLETAHTLVRRAQAGEVAKMSFRDTTSLVNLAEALLTDGEFVGREVANLALGPDTKSREALALELHALIGWIPGGEEGRYNENWPEPRRVMDLVMPAALLKGGHGDVVVRQVRELNAIAGADARTQMEIAVGLASALAMPTGDLSPTQRHLAAELLADRARDIPPRIGTGNYVDPDGPAFSWMLLAAAERMPELARAPSLKPHFDAQSAMRPGSVWRSSNQAPKPADLAATIKATAHGNWWNLAGMIVLAEKTRYPSAWFAALRAERRAKQQGPAAAESRATVQRALDDWFARNGSAPAVREIIQADCALACDTPVEALEKSAAWDAFVVSAGYYVNQELAVDGRMEALLASSLLKKTRDAGRDDPSGSQRWLVDPRWQPGAKAVLSTWKAWLELAGPVGISTIVARAPEHLAEPGVFRHGIAALQPTDDGQLSAASVVIANALLRHAADVTDPAQVKDLSVVRGRCLGDWLGLAAWLDDPRRRPKASDAWHGLYARANNERDQVAGKFEDLKLGPDEDFGLCGRFEVWLKEVLAAKGSARLTLLAESPDDALVQPALRMLGYDVERGGFASRAMLLLANPEFDPRLPVKNGGRYDPEPWLAAVAKLPPAVSAEMLVAQLAATVNSAWTEKFEGGKALDSTFSIQAGVACQRALGRLASRWSPARLPAQEEVLNLLFGVLVEGSTDPNPDCIEARVKWERALMKGLNAADAFAQASSQLRRPELSYIVAVGNSPASLSPLVLPHDDHFFREARLALAKAPR